MRVALYARYSSDLQSERSADDQLAALRQAVQLRGWQVVAEFADRGVSGAAVTTRPGIQDLMKGAAGGAFDVVLTEALDRLSRSQSDTARLFELLSFAGVRIETLSSGPVSELHVGLEGTMNRLFLVELGKKTRRGLVGRVQAGFSGGGRCYGYEIREKGVLAVLEDEAAIVRRIFTAYAGGDSPRAIAHRLNAEGVPGPRGGEWTSSAINGDRRAQDGLLHNELYVGVRVFNRRRFRKHPETGRRSGVLNPPEQWIRQPVPDLRILTDALWKDVQDRKGEISAQPACYARKPKRLLSGLIQCGSCGGAVTLQGQRYACSGARERGTCSNNRMIQAEKVEQRVIEGVRRHLLSPDAVSEAVRIYHDELAADQKDALTRRAGVERQLAEVKRRADRLIDQVADGMLSGLAVRDRLATLEIERTSLESELATIAEPQPVRLHPKAAEAYRALSENLHLALDGDDAEEVRNELRKLIDRVVMTPLPGRGAYDLQVAGTLKALLQNNRAPSEVIVGAGARFAHNLTSGPRVAFAA